MQLCCPDGWRKGKNSCYYIGTSLKTWAEASVRNYFKRGDGRGQFKTILVSIRRPLNEDIIKSSNINSKIYENFIYKIIIKYMKSKRFVANLLAT